jgi:hypothetical protein
MEPRDGVVSILLSSQQAVLACVQCIQKESEGQLSASGGNRKCRSLSNGKPSSCQKLHKSTSKTFQMIKQAYGKEALGCSAVFK